MAVHLHKRDSNEKTGLIPRLDHGILAISSEKDCLPKEVKFSDLIDWRQLNSIYLCDCHGVLDKSASDFCIGALYSHKHDAVLSLCPVVVVELACSLSRNHFVILNTATGFNRQNDCLNDISSELSLPWGITNQFLQDWTLKLNDHIIFSDFSVQLKTDYHLTMNGTWMCTSQPSPMMHTSSRTSTK